MKRRYFKFFSLLLVLVLAVSFSSCGGGSSEPEPAEDGQNPIMNFIGNYQCDRATVFISAEDSENKASAVVTWASSATENSSWMMTGTFDSETLQFEYHDCVKTDYVYGDNGEATSTEEVYTGGHGFIKFSEGDPLTLTWQDDQEHVADGMVFEYVGNIPAIGSDEPGVGMPNPWHTVDSLDAAAEGAGVGTTTFEEGMELSLGKVNVQEYRYMDGMVEIYAPVAAVDLKIRKGRADVAVEPGDISGDYGTYANEWTQNIKGLEVKCYGNRKGEATKTIWSVDDTCYAIIARGAGGDEDFGLSADDLNSLINSIQ